jgi:hypothetical protein
LVERFAVRAIKAPTGDFRDWDAIRDWAHRIDTSIALAEDSAGGRQASARAG